MIKITTWSPDTCKCVIEYQWDSDLPADQRSHTVSKIVSACKDHENQVDKTVHFESVLNENKNKNQAIDLLVKNADELTKLDDDGNKIPDLSKIDYSFDNDRNITIFATGIKSDSKTNAQTAIDVKLGAGKVMIS